MLSRVIGGLSEGNVQLAMSVAALSLMNDRVTIVDPQKCDPFGCHHA